MSETRNREKMKSPGVGFGELDPDRKTYQEDRPPESDSKERKEVSDPQKQIIIFLEKNSPQRYSAKEIAEQLGVPQTQATSNLTHLSKSRYPEKNKVKFFRPKNGNSVYWIEKPPTTIEEKK